MTDAPETPDEIKADARDQVLWLVRIFGEPRALLRRLPHDDWRRLRTWIRALEALAGRLVRLLAAEIEAAAEAPPSKPSWTPPRKLSGAPYTEDQDSARWIGVSLRLSAARTSSPTASRRRSFGAPYVPDGGRSARGLAVRLEALIRLFENPMRRARRWVRRRARPVPIQRPRPRMASGPVRIRWIGPPLRAPVRLSG